MLIIRNLWFFLRAKQSHWIFWVEGWCERDLRATLTRYKEPGTVEAEAKSNLESISLSDEWRTFLSSSKLPIKLGVSSLHTLQNSKQNTDSVSLGVVGERQQVLYQSYKVIGTQRRMGSVLIRLQEAVGDSCWILQSGVEFWQEDMGDKGVQVQKKTGKCPEAAAGNMAGGLPGASILMEGGTCKRKERRHASLWKSPLHFSVLVERYVFMAWTHMEDMLKSWVIICNGKSEQSHDGNQSWWDCEKEWVLGRSWKTTPRVEVHSDRQMPRQGWNRRDRCRGMSWRTQLTRLWSARSLLIAEASISKTPISSQHTVTVGQGCS